MSKQQTLHPTYNDLLGETTDHEIARIVADLDDVCNTAYVPHKVSWQNLRMLHVQHTMGQDGAAVPFRMAMQPWWHSLTRKAILLPAIAVFFIATSAFAFAATPLLQNLLHENTAGTVDPIKYSTLGDINVAQKIGNSTISLEKGYVESNNVVLGLTVTPVNQDTTLQILHLTTPDGTDLATSGQILGDLKGQTLVELITLSNVDITGNPNALKLSLSARLVQDNAKTLGTATMNFALSYHQGEVVAPGIQATSNGKTVTLEKAIIGKTLTTLTFSGLGGTSKVTPQINLQAAAGTAITAPSFAGKDILNGPFIYRFDNDFSQHHGAWTVTITEGTDTWVFHFDV